MDVANPYITQFLSVLSGLLVIPPLQSSRNLFPVRDGKNPAVSLPQLYLCDAPDTRAGIASPSAFSIAAPQSPKDNPDAPNQLRRE
jgi:hypothetical protein